VTNGGAILAGLVDGRSRAARRYTDLIAAVVADQGGRDSMSEARMQLARRFSALAVQCEQFETELANGKQIDITEYATLTSTLVRVVSRIGLNRVAKNITPSLHEYLADEAAE
jgi:hypothetical protein